MIRDVDSKGQKYIEIETQRDKESLRITYVEEGFLKKPCLRINIRTHGKQLKQGPEFDVEKTPEIIEALSTFLLEHK
ncbi:hypothetical protein ACIGLI_13440 [Bacillus subtilis]|uniref:hypothetical protein n=1 Tax=Bacillus TaxID=1386 RepID=UPI000516A494|nr:hypothetical protein [Bacillus subtilis]BEV40965.1 hypothetical protein BSB_40380 [Bacillus stercoris]MBJ3766011.1 hypothetical protein [Bacillus subtilis]MCM3386298.1 hypothetical protein [Bacillus subtilis]MDI6684371.1 hypothetical protein [Bacillus subtilis]MDP0484568.1 hypothetical protein [Bacillus subtilis]